MTAPRDFYEVLGVPRTAGPDEIQRAYRRLAELGDTIPENQQARAELLVADAREALRGEAPLDRIRMLTGELQQIYQGLAATGGEPGGQPGGQGGGPDGAGPAACSDEDVIDADFTTS